MKAIITPKRLSQSERKKVTQTALETTAPAVVAAVLFILYRRGWHKDKIFSLYREIVAFFQYPQVFGQWLEDTEVRKYLSEKIGIDWQELISVVKVE